jgi:hypothetical protein
MKKEETHAHTHKKEHTGKKAAEMHCIKKKKAGTEEGEGKEEQEKERKQSKARTEERTGQVFAASKTPHGALALG